MADQIDYPVGGSGAHVEDASWDDIKSAARSGLFLGCSLALESRHIAEEILGKDCVFQHFQLEDLTKDWKSVYWVVVNRSKHRRWLS